MLLVVFGGNHKYGRQNTSTLIMGAAVLRDLSYPSFQCVFTKSTQGSNARKSPSALNSILGLYGIMEKKIETTI